MNKNLFGKIKDVLEKQKAEAEGQLLKFAKKDKNLKGDWYTQFPQVDDSLGAASDEALEDKAKRIEEYEKMLPVEFALEKKLQNVDLALEKLKKGKYGICESCGKKIPQNRLEIQPEARFCIKCKQIR